MKLLQHIIIVIFISIIFIIIYCKYWLTNIKRHLNDEYEYAHFSEIHKYNYLLYPSLMYTHPQKYVLNDNEALWIPKGWWHWVESYDTIAINFWVNNIKTNDKYDNPFVIQEKLENYDNIIEEINNYDKNLLVWHSSDDILTENKKNKKELDNNEIIITLPGYTKECTRSFPKDKLNIDLINKINPYIKLPLFLEDIKESDVDHNLWISNKYHDTGLHYDNNNGLLCVLKGKKYITLYPPSDTKYLYPLPIIPFWANIDPIQFEYNTYTFIKKLDKNTSLPSSRLLYETLKCYNNKKLIFIISDLVNRYGSSNNIVWGFKLHNNVVRWEIYVYHYTSSGDHNESFKEIAIDKNQLIKIKIIKNNNNLIIHSFDLYENGTIGKDIHFYYNENKIMNIPFFGKSDTLQEDGITKFDSYFVLDESKRFMKEYDNYMKKINYKDNKVFILKYLLLKYNCSYYCIFNKNPDQIFILYLGISINDFILFLDEFKYSSELINHVKTHVDKYKDILHEIAIIYDINTGKPIRTAFYGLV
jgi:hypothetical protein